MKKLFIVLALLSTVACKKAKDVNWKITDGDVNGPNSKIEWVKLNDKLVETKPTYKIYKGDKLSFSVKSDSSTVMVVVTSETDPRIVNPINVDSTTHHAQVGYIY